MASYLGTATPGENFPGTVDIDSLDYSASSSGVILDVLLGTGTGGDADGDTFGTAFPIEIFYLSALDDEFDGTGIAYYLSVYGGAGDDLLIGGDGGNLLEGGTGFDFVHGGTADDIFRVKAGDGVLGDFYQGNGGNDVIQLVAGGTGTDFDLSFVFYTDIDAIELLTAGTAIFFDETDAAITFGTLAGTDEVVFVQNWIDASNAGIYASVMTYIGNDIDAVEWTEDQGDVRAEIDPISGYLAVTYDNNGFVAEDYTTRTLLFDTNAAVVGIIEFLDDGTVYVADFDGTAGPGSEVLLNETYEDFSAGGLALPFVTAFYDYATDSVADGVLDYSYVLDDSGILTETFYEGGDISVVTISDMTGSGYDGALREEYNFFSNGVVYGATFDPTGGVGGELLLTESFEDFSAGGLAELYETAFFDYALDGIPDEILDYSLIWWDNGLVVESAYEGGILIIETTTDLSSDGLAVNFQVQELTYYTDGTPMSSDTIFDAGEQWEQVTILFDTNGDEFNRISWEQNFTVTETIDTNPLTGDDTITWEGDAGDNVISGDADDEIFQTGEGADVNQGNDGDDTFVLSDTNTDGTWGAFYTYAQEVGSSSGLLISAALSGRVQVADTFIGGNGYDVLQGSSLGEVIVLYNGVTASNAAVDSDDARVVGIEEFDMGDGDDVVELTANSSQLAYLTDALIDGGAGADALFGGAGNDSIIGGIGQDRIVGGRGDNVLTGGVAGGSGDGVMDRFYFGAESGGGTTVITDFEGAFDRIYALGYGYSADLPGAITAGVVTISTVGLDTVIELTDGIQTTTIILEDYVGGVTGANFILFDDTPATPPVFATNPTPIIGDSGDNPLTGTADNDTFQQTAGADTMEGLGGEDTFELTSNASDQDGTWGAFFTYAEQVETSGGVLVSAPLSGKVRIDDTFEGGDDDDQILGTSADEALLLYQGSASGPVPLAANFDARIIGIEYINMGGGSDVVDLTSADGQLGYAVDITIDGGAGDDFLFSGAGNDTLIGGTGVDRLIGWKGDDVMTGGLGEEDRFIFGAGAGGGTDTITDFEVGLDTFIGVGYGASGNLNAAITAGVASVATGATDTVITLDDGIRTTDIVLQGVTTLDVNDFVFYA